jgi:CheY-like chemotaxis protein
MTTETILIVDDDPEIRSTIGELLIDEGYAVAEAENGADALAALRKMPAAPCLVLLDLMMPVMNGFDVLREIAADPRLVDVPVVVLSAHRQAESVTGARRFLQKPVTLAQLLGAAADFCRS